MRSAIHRGGLIDTLFGRDDEVRRLAALIRAARNGRSGAVAIRGDPGIGKSTLLQTAAHPEVHLLRVDGFESESTIAFAALQRLGRPLREHLGALPARQQLALRTAAGVADGPPPEEFLVGLGVLGLFAEAGRHRPVVCVIDDAHWLDAESLRVLAFVARRLEAESVAMIFAHRDDARTEVALAGVPAVRLAGLDRESAVRLLTAALPGPLDPHAAARIAAATGGNPLALVDLARELSVHELTFADEPLPVGTHLEAHYLRQARRAPPGTRPWLLVAAAESTGDVDLVTAAAAALGTPPDAGDLAELAGLVTLGATVHFRHPLVRAAVYNAAPGAEQRRAHAAIEAAATALGLVEQAAWHAAKATLGTDEAVAARLDHVAGLAGRRGGLASRARVLARGADLTPPGTARDARRIAAAEAALAAGAAPTALALLDDVDEAALDAVPRGRTIVARAAIGLFTADPAVVTGATADLLRAAELFHGRDPVLEQTALLKAFDHCLPAERLIRGVTVDEVGRRLAAGAGLAAGPAGVILRGLGALVRLPYDRAVPAMRAAVAAIADLDDDDLLRFGVTSVALTTALWDGPARGALLGRVVEVARAAGALQVADSALWIMALAELSGGSPRRAAAYNEQVRELRRAMGYDAENVVNVALLAWEGAPREQVTAIAEGARAAGFGGVHTSAVGALAVRDLAEGHYRDAYHRLKPLIDDPFLQVTPLQLPEYAEAAARAGHLDDARAAADRLVWLAGVNGSPWCRGVAERSVALVAPDGAAEAHFQAALAALADTDADVDRGRTHLLRGEWLRRIRRRRDARAALHAAQEAFDSGGAHLFAQRARGELAALGVPVAAGPRDSLDLTPREEAIARLAAAGRTNAEIGATLFISPNTVDYHLRKVFQKLGVSSRRQLAERLS